MAQQELLAEVHLRPREDIDGELEVAVLGPCASGNGTPADPTLYVEVTHLNSTGTWRLPAKELLSRLCYDSPAFRRLCLECASGRPVPFVKDPAHATPA